MLGLGEMMLPHFPPPIIAIRSNDFDIPSLFPSDKAIGATVITATSINTPAAQSSIVANASARNTF